jgi:hypothetical protein
VAVGEIGRHRAEAPRPRLDRPPREDALELGAHPAIREEPVARGREAADLVPFAGAREALDLGAAHAARPQPADQRADARAAHDADLDAGLLERADHADMGEAVQRAAAEREADGEALRREREARHGLRGRRALRRARRRGRCRKERAG